MRWEAFDESSGTGRRLSGTIEHTVSSSCTEEDLHVAFYHVGVTGRNLDSYVDRDTVK